MLNWSGLWTAHPDFVLFIPNPLFFVLIPTAEGSSIIIVQDMQSSLLSYLGLAILICLVGGVLFFVHSSWVLVSGHIGEFVALIFGLFLECMDSALMTPILWSCTCCLGGPSGSVGTACMPYNWPVAFLLWPCKYCFTDVAVACICLILHVIILPVFVTKIV